MSRRAIVILVLIQLGIVVFGYLCTIGALKFGYGDFADFRRASWFLRAMRYYGWLLVLVPGAWSLAAIWCQSTGREWAEGAALTAGVAATIVIALAFILAIKLAGSGPPHGIFIALPVKNAPESGAPAGD